MKSSVKRIMAVLMGILIVCAMSVPAFAAVDDASSAVSAMSSAFSTITGTITIGNILSVLAIVLASAVAFFFFWWGIRKVIKVVTKSFKSGKVSV